MGIPTETVYGLAADALNAQAVSKIFIAKGRPQDNPLIVHISDLDMIYSLTENPPKLCFELAKAFWPGPLTMVLPKAKNLPDEVTVGLDTVGIRFPSHKVAQEIIAKSGTPLAAPSANLSGTPSPTKAIHVFSDLENKIPLVIDGGDSSVGVESTVIAVKEDKIILLRPGAVTVEELQKFAPVTVDKGILQKVDEDKKVASPGMKYKHYSPKARVIIIDSDFESFAKYIDENKEDGVFAMVFDGEEKHLSVPTVSFGIKEDDFSQAKVLFDSLRRCDELGAKTVFVRSPKKDGVGLAVYNRLLRAAAFTVITL